MNKKQKELTQLLITYLWENDLFLPFYLGSFSHMDYLPNEIDNYYFYCWDDTTLDGTRFSINIPKLNALIISLAKNLSLKVTDTLVTKIINELLSICKLSFEDTLYFLYKEENINNELNYFKHWISRCLLQYWELKKILPSYTGRNHLIIYDKKQNNKLNEELNSKNDNIPFGDFNYNDEFLEKKVFCHTEDNMGLLLSKLYKDKYYKLSSRDMITIYYFWLVLILRNKNTITNFSQSLKEEIMEISIKYSEFKQFEISYYRHDNAYGDDKYYHEIKTFKNSTELNDFIKSENFYFFTKNIYWKYISPLFLTDTNIYDKSYNKGDSILKDVIFSLSREYTMKRICLDNPEVNLGDYPCLAFKINNEDIAPINFDALFLENYFFEDTIDVSDMLDSETIEKFNKALGKPDKKTFTVNTQFFNIKKIMDFDIVLIPLNPKNLLVVVRNELDVDNNLNSILLKFFKKHELSIINQDVLESESECHNFLYFYSVLTYILSKDFIVLPSSEHLQNTKDFVNEEYKFIQNLRNLIEISKISYRKSYNCFTENDCLYIASEFCNYRIQLNT